MMVHEEKKDMENKRREPGFEAECKGSGIMVSVCCITYNQVSYIRDALEGFVNQQTDFAYEVLIHDDASSDGTRSSVSTQNGIRTGSFRSCKRKTSTQRD